MREHQQATPARAASRASDGSWQELDVFRGLAALSMVANHAAIRWFPNADMWTPAIEVAFFVGGFAPVLFFFATGLGSGFQSRVGSGGGHRYGFLNKVVILFCADAFWNSIDGPRLGLDFLGFIALSMLVLEPLRGAKRPALFAAAGVVAVLSLRFVLGSNVLLQMLPEAVAGPLAVVCGSRGVRGLAYPPFPWLALPLLGFIVGRVATGHPIRRRTLGVYASLLALLSLSAAGTSAMVSSGWPLVRYGMMSAAFFVSCFAAISLAGLASFSIARSGLELLVRATSLRGISSLAVVPIHAAFIAVVPAVAAPSTGTMQFLLALVTVSTLVMIGAHATGAAAERMRAASLSVHIWWVLTSAALLCFLVLIPVHSLTPTSQLASSFGQLVLCFLLVLPTPRFIAAPSH